MAPFGGMLRNLIRHDDNASAIGHVRGDIASPIAIVQGVLDPVCESSDVDDEDRPA